jgi:hypothetical protein
MNNSQLFQENKSLRDYFIHRNESIKARVNNITSTEISRLAVDDLVSDIKNDFLCESPGLDIKNLHLLSEIKERNSREQITNHFFRDELVTVDKTYADFTLCLPLEGDNDILICRPNQYNRRSWTMHGNIQIIDNSIQIPYSVDITNGEIDLPTIYKNDVDIIQTNIGYMKKQVDQYNSGLNRFITDLIQNKKGRSESNIATLNSLNLPIKRRDSIPETYTIPSTRIRRPELQSSTAKSKEISPSLAQSEYEFILSVIKDMSVAMERSPRTFKKLNEEEIRDFFLILLNGHYKGSATGETFNGAGKTDILVRYKNENIFVGECKFWKGKKQLSEAIDQLLGYVTWRDTKTSLIFFNKNKDLSKVVQTIKEEMELHPNFIKEYKLDSTKLKTDETIISYRFSNKIDSKKEFQLTVMIFQIDSK